jgi:hypothetical protein
MAQIGVQKYKETLDTLNAWKIRLPDLRDVILGHRSLACEGAMIWTNLAMAFNRETCSCLFDTVRAAEGLRVVITEPVPNKMLELVKRSILYTDLIVVYSGPPCSQSFEPLLEGVRNGGVICDGVPEWFRDLLLLRPLLLSGRGACVQKHYFDHRPNSSEPKWILSDLKYRGDRTVWHNANPEPNAYSVYADLVRPASLDCVYLGRSFEGWKRQIVTSLRSAQELAFASILNLELPYLSRVPLDKLIELRNEDPETFQRARAFLWRAVRECLSFDQRGITVEEFARYLQKTYLEPARREAQEGVHEASAKKYVRRCGPVISTLSLAFNVLMGNSIGMLLDALWLTQQGASEFLESRESNLRKTGNDLYLFDRLEKLAGDRDLSV